MLKIFVPLLSFVGDHRMEQTAPGQEPTARKALEAWNLCLTTNMQTFQQVTNWWANMVKENVSLYAELQASSLEAVQEGTASASRCLSTMPQDMREPLGQYQHTIKECAESSAKVAKLFQNNVQAMWRSSEQCWLTSQQTGGAIQERYTHLSNALTALYSVA
jgi:prophage DNA circulation protein